MGEVMAAAEWKSNAHMIEDVVRLGYLRKEWATLDATYGRGKWWTYWRPDNLVAHDLKTDGVDFRHLPEADGTFQAVTFDGPYKLNGTPTEEVDGPYGVDVRASREGRHSLLKAGMTECVRVLAPEGFLLVKCQDQVEGGKVRWQSRILADHGESLGLTLKDSLLLLGHRPQPKGRKQEHARRNYSTLLVFRGPKQKPRRCPASGALTGMLGVGGGVRRVPCPTCHQVVDVTLSNRYERHDRLAT